MTSHLKNRSRPPIRRKSQRARSGISLLELVVSLPATAMLIGCLGLCIGLMMKAKTQDEKLFQTSYQLSETLSRISSDLESATSIAFISTDRVEFTVPDRNNDGLPEQIKYEWTSLTHSILWSTNNGPQTTLFDDVGLFELTPRSTAVSATVPCHQFSEVAILKKIDAVPACVYKEQVINASNAIGQYFVPDLTVASARWDLGKLRLMVKSAGGSQDGVLRVRVTGSGTSRTPSSTIHAEINIAESSLGPTYRWLSIPIAPISWQNANTPLCITLSSGGGTGDVAYVQYMECATGMPTNANLLTSTNGGTSWTASNGTRGLRHYAYGFYDGYNGNRQFLTSIDLRLVSASNNATTTETSIRMLAKPELLTTDLLTMMSEEQINAP